MVVGDYLELLLNSRILTYSEQPIQFFVGLLEFYSPDDN